MIEMLMLLIGMAGGAVCVYFAMAQKCKAARQEREQVEVQARKVKEFAASTAVRDDEVRKREQDVETLRIELQARRVSYGELQGENTILKRDLQNIDVTMRKLRLDVEIQDRRQSELDGRAQELGKRYLQENVKAISSGLTANNFAAAKQRLLSVVQRCRDISLTVSDTQEQELLSSLKSEYERVVRVAFEREEQARIRAQIRDEQRREKEVQREIERAERERVAVEAALAKMMADTKQDHTAEIEQLRGRLAEAEAKAQRAVSQAQMTKSGNVYVISNIGTFGEGVFKIGMTRRLEPLDRIRELGDASVPFPFDVHMMISCDDAPRLENALHRALHTLRINKANPRKEFFKTDLEAILDVVQQHHGKVEYLADPEALEYRQSLNMSAEDMEFIEHVFEEVEEESEAVGAEE